MTSKLESQVSRSDPIATVRGEDHKETYDHEGSGFEKVKEWFEGEVELKENKS